MDISPRKRWGLPEQPGTDPEAEAFSHAIDLDEVLFELGYPAADVPAAATAFINDLIEHREVDDPGYLWMLLLLRDYAQEEAREQPWPDRSEMSVTENLIRTLQNIYGDEYEFTPIYNTLARFEKYLEEKKAKKKELRRLHRIWRNISDFEDELVGRA